MFSLNCFDFYIMREYNIKTNRGNINGRDVQRKNVVNNVDKSSLWAP